MVASISAGICVFRAESAKPHYHDRIATVGCADMKLGRCVVGKTRSSAVTERPRDASCH